MLCQLRLVITLCGNRILTPILFMSLQAYESQVIDLHHSKLVLCQWKFYKSTSGRFPLFLSSTWDEYVGLVCSHTCTLGSLPFQASMTHAPMQNKASNAVCVALNFLWWQICSHLNKNSSKNELCESPEIIHGNIHIYIKKYTRAPFSQPWDVQGSMQLNLCR